jgi:BRCT domain type II-containing protein
MSKSKRRLIIGLVVLLVSLVFAGGVSASDGYAPLLDDEVVFFGTYTLDSGETLNGSLIVFGGVVSLEEDSTVTGDVIIFGGNVTASGRSKGNLVPLCQKIGTNGSLKQ